MLHVQDVSTHRGRVQVLWDVSLRVRRGETIAVVGPNGAGKSTLVASIVGLLKPSAGKIAVNGAEVTGLPAQAIAAHRVALVPERRGIFAPLTVRENLSLGAYARRLRGAELEAEVRGVFELFPGLVRYAEAIAGGLSGGEQQMVSIGRALMAQPELLLLDEPSLGLAPKIRGEIFGTLGRLAQRGVTVVLIEQNVRLAARICSRAYVMQRGRIVGEESADELAHSAHRASL